MLLSVAPLHFQDQHLEMTSVPRDLHRDLYFRRINYGNNTHVNISVTVGEDNKATIDVALDRNDRPYFGCDAGCLDFPVQLRYLRGLRVGMGNVLLSPFGCLGQHHDKMDTTPSSFI